MRICQCSIGYQQENRYKPEAGIQVPLVDILPDLGRWGYDGVEIWEPHVGRLDLDGFEDVRRGLADHGLAVPMLSSYYNFTKSLQHAVESMRRARGVLEEARWLGADNIRIFTGNHRGEDATIEQWARCVSCLRDLADVAAAYGIGLAAELHDWNLMNTTDNALRLVELVGKDNFGLIFQPSDVFPGHEESLERLAPHIRHVHATNKTGPAEEGGKARGCALAEGRMDWPRMLRRLGELGFTGYVAIEWMGPDPAAMGEREAAWLRGLEAQIDG